MTDTQLPSEVTANPMATSEVARSFDLLEAAIERGIDVTALERLQAMCERAADREAAQRFSEALAAFQAECPTVHKSRTAEVATSNGGKYRYQYANLDDVIRSVGPIAARHGLSWSFQTRHTDHGIVEVCTVRHVGGHSVASESPVVSTQTMNKMAPQQQVGSAQTYARRYALTGALGISTGDADNDAGGGPGVGGIPEPPDMFPVSADQVAEIEAAIINKGVSVEKFLPYMSKRWGVPVATIEDIPRCKYDDAMRGLKAAKGGTHA